MKQYSHLERNTNNTRVVLKYRVVSVYTQNFEANKSYAD